MFIIRMSSKVSDVTSTILQLIYVLRSKIMKIYLSLHLNTKKNNMIQRIQSIYLFIVIIISGIGAYVPFIRMNDNILPDNFDNKYIIALFAIVMSLALGSLLTFFNRKLQMVLARLGILINILLLGVFGYYTLTISGELINVSNYLENFIISEKEIEFFIALISIVILIVACKAIKRDEELVKSVDRLR